MEQLMEYGMQIASTLLITLITVPGALVVGLGGPGWVLATGLAVVAVGSAVTVGQRVHAAWAASGQDGRPGATPA